MTNIGKTIIEKCGAKINYNNTWCRVGETRDKYIEYKREGEIYYITTLGNFAHYYS